MGVGALHVGALCSQGQASDSARAERACFMSMKGRAEDGLESGAGAVQMHGTVTLMRVLAGVTEEVSSGTYTR